MTRVLEGHEDFQPKEVLNMKLVVKDGDNTKEYKVFVLPGGGLQAAPNVPKEVPIDQLQERTPTPIAHRFQGVDQLP